MELLHQSGEIVAQRYRILDILGQGGVGTTYKAEDLQSSEQLALKALSLRRMNDWKKMELFEREARILAQLNHPAIPRYLDYFQVDTPHLDQNKEAFGNKNSSSLVPHKAQSIFSSSPLSWHWKLRVAPNNIEHLHLLLKILHLLLKIWRIGLHHKRTGMVISIR